MPFTKTPSSGSTSSTASLENSQNPLAGISDIKLDAQVEGFAIAKRMQDLVPLLKKGAQLAQNPQRYTDITDLYWEERKALEDEVPHRWRQPKSLYFTVILCSIGAAVQ